MFHLKNVAYKNIIRVDDLEIKQGEITCIVGESGSGKTTLLKLLNHLVDYNQGEIIYQGKDLKGLDAVMHRRKVILLPQTPVVFPGNIKDNLLAGLIYSGKEIVEDRILQGALKEVGLAKNLDADADKLSGGEKQRLALARVLLMDPEVLLLDEPTSALDEDTETVITEYICSYLEKGNKTIVMVTHSRALAKKLGKMIVTVNNGKIVSVEEGPANGRNN